MATARNTMRPYSVLFWDTVRKPSVTLTYIRRTSEPWWCSDSPLAVICYITLSWTLENTNICQAKALKAAFVPWQDTCWPAPETQRHIIDFFLSLHVWQHVALAQMIAVTTCISPHLFLHSLPYPPSFDAAVLYPSLLGGVILSWSARFVGNRGLMK